VEKRMKELENANRRLGVDEDEMVVDEPASAEEVEEEWTKWMEKELKIRGDVFKRVVNFAREAEEWLERGEVEAVKGAIGHLGEFGTDGLSVTAVTLLSLYQMKEGEVERGFF